MEMIVRPCYVLLMYIVRVKSFALILPLQPYNWINRDTKHIIQIDQFQAENSVLEHQMIDKVELRIAQILITLSSTSICMQKYGIFHPANLFFENRVWG
jgi:hypothetical protein